MRATAGGTYSEIVTFYDDLSPREQDVLEELAKGRSNPAIASKLIIAVKTVERYMGMLREKYIICTELNPRAIDYRVLLASAYWEMQEMKE